MANGMGLGSAGVGAFEGLQEMLTRNLQRRAMEEQIARSQAQTQLGQDQLAQAERLADLQARTNLQLGLIQKQPGMMTPEHIATLPPRARELATAQLADVTGTLESAKQGAKPPTTIEGALVRPGADIPGLIDLQSSLAEAGETKALGSQRGAGAAESLARADFMGRLDPNQVLGGFESLAELQAAMETDPSLREGLIFTNQARQRMQQRIEDLERRLLELASGEQTGPTISTQQDGENLMVAPDGSVWRVTGQDAQGNPIGERVE